MARWMVEFVDDLRGEDWLEISNMQALFITVCSIGLTVLAVMQAGV